MCISSWFDPPLLVPLYNVYSVGIAKQGFHFSITLCSCTDFLVADNPPLSKNGGGRSTEEGSDASQSKGQQTGANIYKNLVPK